VILVDTTVWIDFFADRENEGTRKFTEAVENEEDLAICGFVLTEVLQGIRTDSRFRTVEGVLDDLILLPASKATFLRAAQIYRRCRKKGVTIRKPIDCMIAAVCIEQTSFILHNDRDFDHIARHFPLQNW
jgi:hypothetical protein